MDMKKALSYLIIFSLLFGCAPTPYFKTIKTVYDSPTPGFESERRYFDRIFNKLKSANNNNDSLLAEYYEIAILILTDSYIIIDDDTISLIENKENEYVNSFLPSHKKLFTDGISKMNATTKDNRKAILNQVNNDVSKLKEAFYEPILKIEKQKREHSYGELTSIVEAKGDNIPFIDIYMNLLNYYKQEKLKINLQFELFKEYDNMIKVLTTVFESKITEKQKDKLYKLSLSTSDLQIFTNELEFDQIIAFASLSEKVYYKEYLRKDLTTRLDKSTQLAKWINENKANALDSLQREDTIRVERAKALISVLLIGLGVGLSAYGSYLSRPTTIQQPTLLQPYKSNTYGPGINSDATGRPFTWQPQTPQVGPTIPDPTLKVRPDVYGPGIGTDQYGRPVTGKPWPNN